MTLLEDKGPRSRRATANVFRCSRNERFNYGRSQSISVLSFERMRGPQHSKETEAAEFARRFQDRSVRVQNRLQQRSAWSAFLTFCACIAIPLYLVRTLRYALVPALGVMGVIVFGAVIFTVIKTRRLRWNTQKLALYLDASYASHELITTAEEAERSHADAATLFLHANLVLQRELVLPPFFRRSHWFLYLGPLVLVASFFLPAKQRRSDAEANAGSAIKITADSLDRVAALQRLPPFQRASPEEKARLLAIAQAAEKLKADLEKGLTEQEALDRIGRLQDALREERQQLGGGERKQGLESAAARLDETAATRKLAEALRDRDLTKFDAETERLANAREQADRDAAKKALQEAIEQAKRNGAPDVAKALKSELQSLESREQRNEHLSELGQALDRMAPKTSELKQTLKDKQNAFDKDPSDANAQALAKQMEKALAGMSKEEREQLAKNLAKLSNEQDTKKSKSKSGAPSKPPSDEELEKMLKDLGSKDLTPPEAQEDEALKDSEDAAKETAKMLKPGDGKQQGQGQGQGQGSKGDGKPGSGGQSASSGGNSDGSSGGAGGSHDTGTGPHNGKTDVIPGASDLRARARTQKNKGTPVPGGFTVLGQGREPGVVTEPRTGDLKSVAGKELHGIDQSDVPSEYRDQLHEYFQP
jgi:hypothetical protein